MAQSVSGFFARYSDLVRTRDLRAAANLHRYPCMIELLDDRVVAMDAEQLVGFLSGRLDLLARADVKDVSARVAAVEMPRASRFRVWVRWSYHYADRVEPDGSGMIYYLVRSPGGRLSIEMMAFVSMAPIEAAARESGGVG